MAGRITPIFLVTAPSLPINYSVLAGPILVLLTDPKDVLDSKILELSTGHPKTATVSVEDIGGVDSPRTLSEGTGFSSEDDLFHKDSISMGRES